MKKIFVAGHNGMVGRAICRKLASQSGSIILVRDRKDLNLLDQNACFEFIKSEKPDEIILAAAKVGGIHANSTYPAEFIYQNLQIQINVIHSALNNVQRLLFLGSSCIYPKLAEQPMNEATLLEGKLEPTNEPMQLLRLPALKCAKVTIVNMEEIIGHDAHKSLWSRDNYHLQNSHAPALIRRFHEAKVRNLEKVVVWGTGRPRREFLYVDDMAEACLHINSLDKLYIKKYCANDITCKCWNRARYYD